MTTPPPVIEESAIRWFTALANLPSDAVVVAVQEFFHLSWAWNQIGPMTGLVFEDLMSLLYKAFHVLSENPGDLFLAEKLIKYGIKWPERFGFMLERTRIGGGNVIRAMNRAHGMMDDYPANVRSSMIDFALQTGWYLLSEDDLPVWRSIGRTGESLYRKMRGFSLQMEVVRTLGGFLGKLEEEEALQELILDAKNMVISDIVGDLDVDSMEEVTSLLSERALAALRRRAERNISLDILNLSVSDSAISLEYGRAIAQMVLFTGAGTAFYNCFRAAYSIASGTDDNRKIVMISRMASERKTVDYLERCKTEYFLDFMPLALLFLEGVSTADMKRTVSSAGRLMDYLLALEDPSDTIEGMKEYLETGKTDREKLLTAVTLMFRSSKTVQPEDVLSKGPLLAELLSILDADYRRRVLEGEQTDWLIPLLEDETETFEGVVATLERINNPDLRGRFMDKVMAPIMQETDSEDPVFKELLSTALATYNREMSLDQLRQEETSILGKLFRAEDRSKALRKTMESLLRIPGIEERNASDLVYSARLLCDTLSQQAVWLDKTGHRIFSRFLSYGLTSLVKTLVEYPDIAEMISGSFIKRIIDTIIPSKETEDSDVALWQLRTASVFFGRIIPLTTELMADNPEILTGYFEELAELTVMSKRGEPAGAEFLIWVSDRLERELIKEFARKMTEESGYSGFLDKFETEMLMSKWRKIRDFSSVILKDILDSLQIMVRGPLHRRVIMDEGRKLSEGFIELGSGGIISVGVNRESRKEIEKLKELAGDKDVIEILRVLEDGYNTDAVSQESEVDTVPEPIGDFFSRKTAPPGQNVCRHWRKQVFTTFENILIDIMLLCSDNEDLGRIDIVMDDFLSIVNYLGTDDDYKPDIVLTAMEKSLSKPESGGSMDIDSVTKNLDRNVYKLMWLRKATRKAAEAVSGYVPGRKISIRLFDRISREDSARDQILFMKNFGRIFAALESEIMRRKPSEIKSARSVLDHLWIFNPDAAMPESALETAREAVETVAQFFLEVSTRTGAVSASEAGAISLGMRRKYRDNANTVAILIKWTQDSSRADLLSIVEAHQPLLEAVSRDSELIQMIDRLWSNGKARLYIRSLADRPDKLKKSLSRFADRSSQGNSDGLRFI
ncbi:MAG: hypothetical protein GF388_05455 [Candidatus Aegiribacteria sp.]|nr:hypothetical protein [Candidatus Aegiribacteria sp.]MBD3294650.1 hypothetical protein [Candidatus Fermentibacteria bacterium]